MSRMKGTKLGSLARTAKKGAKMLFTLAIVLTIALQTFAAGAPTFEDPAPADEPISLYVYDPSIPAPSSASVDATRITLRIQHT